MTAKNVKVATRQAAVFKQYSTCHQGLEKRAILCFRNPYFYFQHGESTSAASQQTSTASQLSKDLNKVHLLLQNLGGNQI